MIDLTRRQILHSGAAAAALGLSGSLAFMPAAQAADVRKKGYYSYKVGSDIEVISIYDGFWNKAHADNFIPGVTVDQTKEALRKAGAADEHVHIEFAITAIKTGGETILIDAGSGAQLAPTSGLVKKGNLKAAGIDIDSVTKVVVSHMHPDHIFGLMAKDTNAQIFPNAEILVNETEYKFWTDPGLIAKLPEFRKPLAQRIQATFPKWKNVTQFGENADIAPGVKTKFTPGHTPGHSAIHLSSGDDQLLIIGDSIIVPALFLTNLDWQLIFDSDRDQATATRKKIVDKAVADNIPVAGYHFGFPNSGKIEKDGSSFVFNPTSV